MQKGKKEICAGPLHVKNKCAFYKGNVFRYLTGRIDNRNYANGIGRTQQDLTEETTAKEQRCKL
jgi:hypothetical protein